MQSFLKSSRQFISNTWYSLGFTFRAAPVSSTFMVILATGSVALGFASSKIIANIIDSLIAIIKTGITDQRQILILILLWALSAGAVDLINICNRFLRLQQRYTIKTGIEFFILKKRLSFDLARYEDADFQNLLQRAFQNRGYWPLQELGTSFLPGMYSSLLSLIISSVLIGFFDWRIYLLIVVSVIPSFVVDLIIGQRTWNIWSRDGGEEQRRYFNLRYHIQNSIPRAELKIYQAGEKFLSMIKSIYDKSEGEMQKNERSRLFWKIGTELFSALGFGVAIYIIVNQVVSNALPIGQMTFLVAVISRLSSSIGDIFAITSDMVESSRYVTEIKAFIETESLIKTEKPVSPKLDTAPTIRFENVTFAYPKEKTPAIKNLTLTIQPGEKIGLVGNNGAGKSTFIKLLCRIYDPSEGDIFINDINLKNIEPEYWQKYISVLLQDFASYSFKVDEAIAISDPNETLDLKRVKKAAHSGQAAPFIEQWEKGYNEQLGKDFNGKEPSKGQRQKLALARTLYRKAHILLLDEPTAAIDAESEIEIFKTLDNYSKDTTAVYISHDFSTIRRANRIIVFSQGELIEDGTHEKLMKKKKGLYAKLFTEQLESFTKKNENEDK